MTFPNQQQRETAKKMIADHDKSNFYTFDQRVELLSFKGNYMAGLANKYDPMQVGDLLCELDNQRIPFNFRPEVSAQLARNKKFCLKTLVKPTPPTVDDNVRELLLRIMEEGDNDTTRTGIKSRGVNGVQHTYDISMGQVPAVSSKYTWIYGVKVELVWMISGDTNIRFLKARKVNIWDSWVKPGTEEYHILTVKEIQDAIVAHFGVGYNVSFETVTAEETVSEPLRNEIYEIGEYGLDEGKEQRLILTYDLAGLQQCYLDLLGVEPKELVAGELPRIYQHQWRGWEDTRVLEDNQELDAYKERGFEVLGNMGPKVVVHRKIDQLQKVIDQLRDKPDDRGIILSAWNVAELDEMALRPCHTLCQFFSKPMTVKERLVWLGTYKPAGFEHLSQDMLNLAMQHDDRRHEAQFQNDAVLRELLEQANVPTRKLSSLLYMRSNDIPLGHPFNIVQYSMLTHMIAQCVGMATDTFTYMGGDCHIYEDQWPGVLEWLEHDAHPDSHPTIRLNPNVKNIFDFKVEDIEVVGYKHTAKIKFPKAAV
jgi:thymidylate synthase